MKNKKAAVISGVCIIMMSSITAYALFTSNPDERINTVTVGNNVIEVTEDASLPDEKHPQTKKTAFKKSVSIENTGNIPCYIRVRLDFSSEEIRKISEFSPQASSTEPSSSSFVSLNQENAYSIYANAVNNLIDEDKYSGTWEYKSDGYFYYTAPVEAGKSTPSLLEWVRTNYVNNDDKFLMPVQDYDIYVYAESVQTIGNDGTKISYTEAWNQF